MVRASMYYNPAYEAHLGLGPGMLPMCKAQLVNWLSKFQLGDIRLPEDQLPDLEYLANDGDIIGDHGEVIGRKARLLNEKRVRLMPSDVEIVFPVNSIVSVYFDEDGVASSVQFNTDQMGQPILAPGPAPAPPQPNAQQMGGRRRATRRRATRRRV